MYSPRSQKGPPAETKAAIEFIISDLDLGIKDEREAIRFYEHMVATYGNYGWRWIFQYILDQERQHLEKLLEAKRAVQEETEKAGLS